MKRILAILLVMSISSSSSLFAAPYDNYCDCPSCQGGPAYYTPAPNATYGYCSSCQGGPDYYAPAPNATYGYCPSCQGAPMPCAPAPYFPCDPCDTPASVCGANCGLSVCSVAAAIAAVIGVAAIIVASPNSSNVHSAN